MWKDSFSSTSFLLPNFTSNPKYFTFGRPKVSDVTPAVKLSKKTLKFSPASSMAELLEECGNKYTILEPTERSDTFIVEDKYKTKLTLRFISPREHPFALRDIKVSNAVQRTRCMTSLLAQQGIGPELVDVMECRHYLILVTEYIENPLTSEDLEDNKLIRAVKDQIRYMHSLGIVHGNLSGDSFRYDDDKRVYVVNPDAAFFEQEYSGPFKKWVKKRFDINSLGEIMQWEEDEGYTDNLFPRKLKV